MRWVCKNLQSVITTCTDCPEPKYVWRFPYPGCRITAQPAQKLLFKLCKRQILKDEHLNLFSSKYVDLVSPVLRDVGISPNALRILRDFTLTNLTATNLKNISLNSILGCLGETTVDQLVSLNITCSSIEENNIPVIVSLGRLRNLQVLNVSRTKLGTESLRSAVSMLPSLRHLNISRTNVSSICCLRDLRDKLTGLVMHRAPIDTPQLLERALQTILELKELRILDISAAPKREKPRTALVDKLCAPGTLPHLRHFDICGNQLSLTLEDVE